MFTHHPEKEQYIDLFLNTIHTFQLLTQTRESMEQTIQEMYYDSSLYKELVDLTVSLEERERRLDHFYLQTTLPVVGQKFISMLLRHDKLTLLDDQDKPTFLFLFRQKIKDIHTVQVKVADYLSGHAIETLHKELSEMLTYKFVFDLIIDPSIIGGLALQTDATLYEDTVIKRLQTVEPSIRSKIHTLAISHLDEMLKQDILTIRQGGTP